MRSPTSTRRWAFRFLGAHWVPLRRVERRGAMGEGHERELAEKHYEPPMPEGDEPPPRGTKVMAVIRWILLGATIVLAAFTWLSFARAQLESRDGGTTQARPTYHCPMHPQIVSNETGEC